MSTLFSYVVDHDLALTCGSKIPTMIRLMFL